MPTTPRPWTDVSGEVYTALPGEREGNAALIVAAVNVYAEARELIQNLAEGWTADEDQGERPNGYTLRNILARYRDDARALLARMPEGD